MINTFIKLVNKIRSFLLVEDDLGNILGGVFALFFGRTVDYAEIFVDSTASFDSTQTDVLTIDGINYDIETLTITYTVV